MSNSIVNISKSSQMALPGRRVYQKTQFGEEVPFRAIDQERTPECFGERTNPTFYTNDVTGHFFDNSPVTKRVRS